MPRCWFVLSVAEVLVLMVWIDQALSNLHHNHKNIGSGCADGTTEGFQDESHPKIAACTGHWHGHVKNSSNLCAPGWRVCAWHNEHLLKTITWKDATALTGCFAMNAAQDGGRCKPCISHMEQDDLAGVGRGCPHQSFGQKSCITGGQIDVSCCVDTHFHRACQFRPGLATGVLCCKLPGVPPQILVRPQPLTHVTTGVTFVLSCQAMGSPTPVVTWYRNGISLPNNVTRISVFDSGYLLISQAAVEDSGDYECRMSNIAGSDKASAKVIITAHPSGCSDGTTDGLAEYENVHACKGKWQGHVKRGRTLCARGWHVCNQRDTHLLRMLTWHDTTESVKGCYAYNAANTLNRCARCHREDMAGVGSTCSRARRTHKSCLAEGRIDVFKGKAFNGCHYAKGHTTGVLCCKKIKRMKGEVFNWYKKFRCSPKCANGGECKALNRCQCASGYKGAWCQNAVCPGGCIPNSSCVQPGVCRCRRGYTGKKCRKRTTICRHVCQNGGRCKQGKCKCPSSHHGNACQHLRRWRNLVDLNRTE